MYAYEDLMLALESEGLLDRHIEFLPSSEEMADRRRANRGLERPELAVLLAYAKRSLTGALLRSELPDDPFLAAALRDYFPGPVVERFYHRLGQHPLRRELVATIVANTFVAAPGPTFVSRLVAELGTRAADVVRAYIAARDLVGATARWEAIERLDRSVARAALWELMEGVDRVVEAPARWYLKHAEPGFDLGREIEEGRPAYAELADVLPPLGAGGWGGGGGPGARRAGEQGRARGARAGRRRARRAGRAGGDGARPRLSPRARARARRDRDRADLGPRRRRGRPGVLRARPGAAAGVARARDRGPSGRHAAAALGAAGRARRRARRPAARGRARARRGARRRGRRGGRALPRRPR